MVLHEAFDAAISNDANVSRRGFIERVADGNENVRGFARRKGEACDAGALGGGKFRVDAPLQQLHLVVARSGCFLFMGVRRLKVRGLRDDRPGRRSEEHVSLIGATRSTHVGHAETFDPLMNVVVAEAVILGIGAELHHSEGSRGSGEKIDAIIGIATRADEWIDTMQRSSPRRPSVRFTGRRIAHAMREKNEPRRTK